MAATWKTVRVFISSTFRDMHAERDHLVKVTFPALRERLEKHRIYLTDIDLRWGVTREQAENDQVLDLCLQQIDECRPFFIGILGERYGWVPTRYPADALKKFGWIQHHTGKSVTELEILHGVLENRQMRGRAFFYFRDPVAIQPVPESIRRAVYAETDRGQIEKLLELKTKIRLSGCPVMENYPARWDPEAYDRPSQSKGRLVNLSEFGQRVHDQLWQAIQEEYQLPAEVGRTYSPSQEPADPLAEEQDYHERFIESRMRVYVGREQINDALLAFADGNDPFPCLVTGPSGSGKSAALARFVQTFSQSQLANQKSKTLIIPHFIGASPRSTNLRDMLLRFCQVLKARFGFAEDVPEEVAKILVTFREFVGKVRADTRVLLVIDALNQLDETDRAQELYWLPTVLPPHMKIIVSCIDSRVAGTLRVPSAKKEPVLEAFRHRQHHLVQLAALNDAEQRLIIRQVPSLSAKTLDDDQVHLLLSNPATANPLFLLVALEELRGFAPYERLNERIGAFPREGDTVTAIFTQVIDRLAEEFNQKLVETVLALLASSRRGLSERELQELVAGLNGADDLFPVLRQLRPYLLSRGGLVDFYHHNLLKALRERYLATEEQQRQAHVRLADYFNAQDYWLESLEEQRARANRLPPTPRLANVRKVDELPWQLLQAADWTRCEQLLTDLAFLEAKAEAGMVFDLAADFSAAIEGMPGDRPLLRILRLLEEAFRRDIHFIARHPTTIFQCLWNTCWWYDCPNTPKYYHHKGLRTRNRPNRGRPVPNLSTFLECWRAKKDLQTPGFAWIRSLRPPIYAIGGHRHTVFNAHGGEITSVASSDDCIFSGSNDYTVRIWNADTGAQQSCLDEKSKVRVLTFDTCRKRLAIGLEDRTIRIVEADSGVELLCLLGHTRGLRSLSFDASGKRIASGSSDTTVRAWDADSGIELACLRGHTAWVWAVSIAPDGLHIASGSNDCTIRLWDIARNVEIACLRGHEGDVYGVSWSPDGRRIVSGSSDRTVRVWDADSSTALACLRGHEGDVESVSWSPDGRRIVSGSQDRTVRVWDADNGTELHCLRGHEDRVTSVSWSSDGRRIVSGSLDRTVRVWDADPAAQSTLVQEDCGYVWDVLFDCTGRRVACSSSDGKVRIWYSDSGVEFACLSGHQDAVTSMAWFPDGRHIVTGSKDQTARIWDTETEDPITVLQGHESGVERVAVDPDGCRIASGGGHDRTVRLWNAATGQEIVKLVGQTGWITSLAFAPDGQFIAGGSSDNTVLIWDADSGREIARLAGHEKGCDVSGLRFSNDGSRLLSVSGLRTVRIWNTHAAALLACHQLRSSERSYYYAAFSPDARLAVVASSDDTIIWDFNSGSRLKITEAEGLSIFGNRTVPPPLWESADCQDFVIEAPIEAERAWFPCHYDNDSRSVLNSRVAAHPSGLLWVLGLGRHLHLIRLESNAFRPD